MSEPRQTVKNAAGTLLGYSKWGVFWSADQSKRLGTFDERYIYSNSNQILATLVGDKVIASNESQLGAIKMIDPLHYELYIDDKRVGCLSGSEAMAAAAGLVFFYQELEAHGHRAS